MADEIRLTRSGDAPLSFDGELIREASGETGRNDTSRWHELEVYELADGRYVAAAVLHTQWQGEYDIHSAALCDNGEAVAEFFRNWNPAPAGIGFPPGESYAERQERLTADLRRRYGALVADLLDDDRFAERLPPDDPMALLRSKRDDRRYRELLRIGLDGVDFSVAEASLIVDALNGHGAISIVSDREMQRDGDWLFWRASVADHVRLNQADQDWGVDWDALGAKLQSLDLLQQLAIADAAERWWRDCAHEASPASLIAVGLVRRS